MVFGKGPLVQDNDGESVISSPGVLIFSIKNRYCLMEEDQVRNKENRNSHMRQWKFFLEFREKTNAAVK